MSRQKLLKFAQGLKAAYPRNKSVVAVFEQIAKKYPKHTALECSKETMNYAELEEKANQLARYLRKRGVKTGDLVGIYLERSIGLFVGILGVLKAGAAYVPLDSSYPMKRKIYMIEDAKLKVLITSSSFASEFPVKKVALLLLDKIDLSSYARTKLGLKIGPLDLAYVNYTSGTTGMPKGVEIRHRGINRFVKHPHWTSFSSKDRFLQVSNISFDALTQELWGALLNGATLCIYPYLNFSPRELGKFIEEYKITQIVFTSRLFTLMVEEALEFLKKVRCIGVGGDIMSSSHAKMVLEHLPSCRLINEYGPVENTTCTTTYTISREEDIEHGIPIGRPIGNTTAYVLDEKRQLTPFGSPGELYVGGDGLAKGYLNRPDLTKEKFVSNPFGKGLLYKTGDLASYLPDGNLLFLGRIDTQVKIRGFRIELGEIEEILRSHPSIAYCVVVVQEVGSGDKKLIAYAEAAHRKKISSKTLKTWASSQLPSYMLPHFFMIVKKLPITPNGKVDRKALPPLCQEKRERKSLQTKTEKVMGSIWSQLLHRDTIDRQDHFFEIGGDSIMAMQLASKVDDQFHIETPIRLIFENATLAEYASRIEELRTKKIKKASSKIPFSVLRKKEAVLDPSIHAKNALAVKKDQYTNPKKIFLTGATGLVGAFFLKELIENTKAHVYCLIRATSEKDGWKRLTGILREYQIWKPQHKKRITILAGALEKPLLGLNDKVFQTLGGEIDSIFHIGAFVNHALAYEQHKGANVLGTQEVLRLACTRQLKPFYLISSLAILEGIKAKPIPEDADIDESGELLNGYVESKWVSEKLTLLARSRGVPCSIFRLPRVGGDSQIGSGPTGDFLWRLIQASIRLKMVPKINATDDLTPVDYVCKSIRIISQKPKWIQSQFHVISPHILRYLDVFKFLQALGYQPLPFVDFSTWRKTLIAQSKKTGDHRLQALAALLEETHFSKQLHRLTFSSNHLREALKGSRLKCPPIDQKLFKKYVDYYVSIGFLPNIT